MSPGVAQAGVRPSAVTSLTAHETGLVQGSLHSWDISTGVDGPGTRFVVRTPGCPLRCVYCHDPDPWRMRAGERVTADEVLGYDRLGREKYAALGLNDLLPEVPGATPEQIREAHEIFAEAGLAVT